MLDEPFAGVDPIAVQDIQSIVAKLKHKNIGILITDHNVYETLSICDRAYLLFEGKVLFQGTAEQLAENEIVREKYLGKDFVLRNKFCVEISPVMNSLSFNLASDMLMTAIALLTKWANTGIQMFRVQ